MTTTSDENDDARPRRGKRRLKIGAVALVGVTATALGVTVWQDGNAKPSTTATESARVATATVTRTDLSNAQTLNGTLGYSKAAPVKGAKPGLVTWLPAPGARVTRGHPLYKVDNVPVPVFYGSTPLYRTLSARGTTGPDVRVVADNLKRLGYDIGSQPAPGTWVTQHPAPERFPTAVLGSVAATRMGIAKVVPGQQAPQIYINQRWFTVIGILARTPLSPDIDRSVLVGWDAARTQLNFAGHPTVIYVKAREDGIDAVRDVLAPTIYPELPGMVQVSRPSDALAAERATRTTFSALFLGLAGVALLVGGIGVANTMVISVLERRKEIGLRRALGANRGQIRSQFLTESVALSCLGGLAGTVLGVLATVAYATYQGWPPVIPFAAVAGGFGGAVLIGMAAGVYPAIRASRLTPTEALATA